MVQLFTMNIVAGQLPEIIHLPGFYEPCSAISHLFGAVAFIFLGCLLLRRGWGNRTREIFLGVYVSSCIVLLSLSGVYHMMVRGGTAREVMERLDHGAIFILIAGTCTPAHGLLFPSPLRWGLLLLLWTTTIAAITLKTIFFTVLPEWLGLSFYLALGWSGFIPAIYLVRWYGFAFVKPLLLGGIIYSAGATLEFLNWLVLIPGLVHPHELFHLAVLGGAFCHWLFVWQFATGEVRVW
jgi:channel protein (hemolysin III family)